MVSDSIEGAGWDGGSPYLLAPGDVSLQLTRVPEKGVARMADGGAIRWVAERGVASIGPAIWYPRFDKSVPNRRLTAQLECLRSLLRIAWSSRE